MPLHWGTLDPDLTYSFVIRLILWVADFHVAANQGQAGQFPYLVVSWNPLTPPPQKSGRGKKETNRKRDCHSGLWVRFLLCSMRVLILLNLVVEFIVVIQMVVDAYPMCSELKPIFPHDPKTPCCIFSSPCVRLK